MQTALTLQLVIYSLVAGLFATAVMDLGALVGTKLKILNKPNLAFLGRWIGEIFRGRLRVQTGTIAAVAPLKNEKSIGLLAHYLIGGVLGLVYGCGLIALNMKPTLANALVFGFLTNAFPWLVMFPALGFGFFASKVPPEAKLLRTSLVNHLTYGLGLILATTLINSVF